MRVGVPKEIKANEHRVGLSPASVRELVQHGHQVCVEAGCGSGSGFSDAAYAAVGASIVPTAREIFEEAELIVKVKEPQPEECRALREGQVLFTYLHLAADPIQADLLAQSGCTAVAYETVTAENGSLPLLAPMSEVAGRLSVQVGARCLEKMAGGPGVLLGGVPGVRPAKVVVLGGGVSGSNAVRIALGMEADVTVVDVSVARLRALSDVFGARLKTRSASAETIEEEVLAADLVIGAVLIPGALAPKLIPRSLVRAMRRGAALVDISIDQGGCFETSRPTTHSNPTYEIDGVIHYCVTNMPGAVARTSTLALNNATLPYVLLIADNGVEGAIERSTGLANGLNVHRGQFTHPAVARDLKKAYLPPATATKREAAAMAGTRRG